MNNPKAFVQEVKKFDKDHSGHLLTVLKPYIDNEDFKENVIKKASNAAVGLFKWVHTIYSYIEVVEHCKRLGHKTST